MTVLVFAFLVCLTLTLHPYVTYPLSLWIARRYWPKPIASNAPAPTSFAIACCVYNEASVVREKIANMFALQTRLGDCQILMHSDCSSDGTNEILREFEDRITLSFASRRSGKSTGMNALMSMTQAEIIIFTDANVTIDPETVGNVSRYFRDTAVGCVTGHLRYVNPDESETARTGSLYWALEENIKQLESDTGSVMGADGSLFAIRRALFHAAPVDIIDDFHSSMSILCGGHRLVRGADFMAYERGATVRKDEMRRKIRIACRAFNCHRLLWPKLMKLDGFSLYKYLSHKVLRWLSGYFILLGAALAAIIVTLHSGLIGLAVFALGLTALALLAAKGNVPVLSTIWEILVATAATAIGVYRSLRGERFQTWTVASSTRK